MSSSELEGWIEYYRLEPFGQWRDNYHSAQIAHLIYNLNRGKSPALEFSEFFYRDQETAAKIRDQRALAALVGISKNGDESQKSGS